MRQQGGNHYEQLKIEPWDFVLANDIGYMEGCVIKYVSRWRMKGGVVDLRKAAHYLERLIKHVEDTERANAARDNECGRTASRVGVSDGTTGQFGKVAGPTDSPGLRGAQAPSLQEWVGRTELTRSTGS